MGLAPFKKVCLYSILLLCFLTSAAALTGCTPLLNSLFNDSLPPESGVRKLAGISENITVRRDDLGIPMIEAASLEDLVFGMGYVSACDRFTQMDAFRLVGQGRLSELVGKASLEMDMYLRALDLDGIAESLYKAASPELAHMLKRYADGVNAYLADIPTPMQLRLAGRKPEKWEPIDSVRVFVVLTLGLAQNLHEEIDILNVAQKVGPEKAAWLFPIYPDEPLPFDEMKKLEGIDLSDGIAGVELISQTVSEINRLVLPAAAASNNWVVSSSRTASGKPILANDTHLPLSMPSIWHMVHLKCQGLEGAGIALAGVPGVIAGYNGHIAVGMTMVMADNQDLFLEKLKEENGELYYLYKGKWEKTASRKETIRVRGGKDVTITIRSTRHGVLLNNILSKEPRHQVVPMPPRTSIGIAASWALEDQDRTMDSFFRIMTAKSVDEALSYVKGTRSLIPLNMVFADDKDIAWQVTGRFPIRKKGRGLCPSPGWTGEYDWQGFLDPSLHPGGKNPDKGFWGTANNRTVPADFPYVLSSSWYYPDRGERIEQILSKARNYTAEDAKAMQLDVYSPFASVIKHALLSEDAKKRMAAAWNKKQHKKAEEGLMVLENFDGYMRTDSAGAAFCGAFLSCLCKNLFADELGGEDSPAYRSLLEAFLMAYSSLHDHLTDRCNESPFWDDISTTEKETKEEILAKTVLDAVTLLEKRCGKDPARWQWGKLHTYTWKTDTTKFADYMGFFDRLGIKALSWYFDRGPFPAPGDHTTLNAAAYHPGNDFDVWLIPEMRIIVDFGSTEPLVGINSSGQSDNPASPHYDDGIKAWLDGRYQEFPFTEELMKKQYKDKLVLVPKR